MECRVCGCEVSFVLRNAYVSNRGVLGKTCKSCLSKAGAKRALASKYGLTEDEYHTLLESQLGVCKICGTAHNPAVKGGRLAVDHDHGTGAIRGLLCRQCNSGLGMFRDSPDLMRNAIRYLEDGLNMGEDWND